MTGILLARLVPPVIFVALGVVVARGASLVGSLSSEACRLVARPDETLTWFAPNEVHMNDNTLAEQSFFSQSDFAMGENATVRISRD